MWALALTLGLFLLTGVGYCLVRQQVAVGDYITSFKNVAAIWFERNILLANTIWPRQAYLQVVECRDKVGRNIGSTPLRVKAIKWTSADREAAEGWRACTVGEAITVLREQGHKDQVENLYEVAIATEHDPHAATLDSVELAFGRISSTLNADTVIRANNVFATLAVLGDSPKLAPPLPRAGGARYRHRLLSRQDQPQ